MANKLTRKKPNRLLSGRNNYYSLGATLDKAYNNLTGNPNKDGKLTTGAFKDMSTDALSALSAGATAVGNIGGKLISGGFSTGAGSAISGLSGIASAIPGFGAIAGAGLNIVGGLVDRMFGSKMNDENIAKVEGNINQLNSFQSDASDFDTLSDNWSNSPTGMSFSNSFIGKDGWFSNKAKNKANSLRNQVAQAEQWVESSLINNANNIANTQAQNLLANYAAFGGGLQTHGANFDTGLTFINTGGQHEQNPYEGVPMGVDPQGIPNLVEEGEVIYNDYVFSNRLKVPKTVRNKYKLRGNKPLTFADAAMQLSKESEERPNDPISKNGLEALLGELAQSQETLREKRNKGRQFAHGGQLGILFEGDGPKSNRLKHNNEGIDFSYLYMPNSEYMKNRQFVLDNWDNPFIKNWRQRFIDNINEHNAGLKGFTPYNMDTMTLGEYERLSMDKKYGKVHQGTSLLDPTKATITKHLLKGKDGVTELPKSDWYYTGMNENLDTWEDTAGKRLTRLNSGKPTYSIDPESGAQVITYGYSPIEQKEEKAPGKIFVEKTLGEKDWGEGMDSSAFAQSGIDRSKYRSMKDNDGNEYLYLQKDKGTMPLYDSPLRYAPIVGSALGLGMSLFSKPDESSANAILEATKGASTYKPVRFNPIGDYLTYRPFDTEFAANQANALAGATRRNIMNISGGNRAQAMAGILASDYNALNQVGALRRGAAEDNRRQEQIVADFNRGTNQFNSEGFLKADIANQSALANMRELSLKGTMQAEALRQQARLNRENTINTNLSGLFNSLGNIGAENVARKQFKWLSDNGYIRPHQNKQGGKIKRKKKGLTY